MRRSRWLLPVLIAGALASCGGDGDGASSTDPKPALTVPGETDGSTGSTPGTTETTDESTDTAPSADSTTGPMDQPNPGNGGATAPDNNNPPDQGTPPDSPGNDTPPKPGSPADRFEQFCTQNPGAC